MLTCSPRPGNKGLEATLTLFQRVEYEVGSHRTADPPADDEARVDVDHEGHIDHALPGRDISEVADPELVWSLGLELPVYAVQRTGCLGVGHRGANPLAAPGAFQPLEPHQPLNRTARHGHALAAHLPPDLAIAVDLQIAGPDALDLRRRHLHRTQAESPRD